MALNLNGADYSFWNKDEKNKNVSRSGFDLSFKHAYTMNEGHIVPFFEEFLLPYSQLNVGNKFVIWQSPLSTRNFTNQRVHTHYFAQSVKHMWHAYRQQQFGGRYQDYDTPELHFNTCIAFNSSNISGSTILDPTKLNVSSSFQFLNGVFDYTDIFVNVFGVEWNSAKTSMTVTNKILSKWRSNYYETGSLMDYFGFQTDTVFPEEICPNPWLNWLYVGSYRQFFMNKVLWRGDGSDPSSGMRKIWFPDDEEDFSFKVGSGNKSSGLVGRFWSVNYRSGIDLCQVSSTTNSNSKRLRFSLYFFNYFNSVTITKNFEVSYQTSPYISGDLLINVDDLMGTSLGSSSDFSPVFNSWTDDIKSIFYNLLRKRILELLNVIDLFEIRYRNFKNDYFTSALPSPLIGGEASMPHINIDSDSLFAQLDFSSSVFSNVLGTQTDPLAVFAVHDSADVDPNKNYLASGSTVSDSDRIKQALNRAKVNFSTIPGTGITLDNIRMLNATTLYLEALSRSDGDYSSFVRAIYGVTPSELDTKPFYVGGSSTCVITQDVVQTAPENENSDTLFGSVTQRGSAGNSSGIGKVISKDSMIVIGVMSIIPDTLYCQGIDQRWTARDKLDRPNPFFTGIQMQAIHNYEIFVSGDAEKDMDPFGYQGAFDFMRYRSNRVSGLVKPHYSGTTLLDKPFSQMTQVRYFTETPSLNMEFVSTEDNVSHEHLAVTDVETTPEFVVMVANNVSGVLPLPYYAVPQKV